MKLLLENWRRYLNEARTDVLISILERGLHAAIKELAPRFTNRMAGMDDPDVTHPINLGVVSFRFVSESGLKRDVKLQVLGDVYEHALNSPESQRILDGFKPSPSMPGWQSAIEGSEVLQEISLYEKQIAELDKRGILNGMNFVSVAFIINDSLYEISKEETIGNITGAAIDTVEGGAPGNRFRDEPAKGALDLMSIAGPMTPTFSVIAAFFLPEDPAAFRRAFLNASSALVHEVEHSFQKNKDSTRSILQSGAIFEKRVKYLTHPTEIEAHAAQLYHLQRRRTGPWIELAQQFLEGEFRKVAELAVENGMPKNEALVAKKRAADTVLKAWVEFTKKRFPKAELGASATPLSKPPPAEKGARKPPRKPPEETTVPGLQGAWNPFGPLET